MGGASGVSRAPCQIWICVKTHVMAWERGRGEHNPARKVLQCPLLGAQLDLGVSSLAGISAGKAAHGSLWSPYTRWGKAEPGSEDAQSTCQRIWAGS